jgi:hypothetical protein
MRMNFHKIFSREDKYGVVALILFVGITLVIFSPLLLNISNSTLAPNITRPDVIRESRDRYHFIWNFWWESTALSGGKNVLYTNMMFAPNGVPLVLQTMDYVDGAIFGPVALLLGNVTAYNVIIIMSFILSFFTAFLLGRHLTESWIAGFGSGVVFAFFPQHVNQALFGHPNLSSLEWMPAYLLALIMTYEHKKLRYPAVAGIFLALITFTELEQLVMVAIATGIYLLFVLITTRFSSIRSFLCRTSIMIAVWLTLTSIYFVQAFEAALTQSRAPPPISQIFYNSAKPIFYLTPQPASYLYGTLFAPNYSPLSPFLNFPHPGGTAQWIIFIGFVTLTISILGVIMCTDRKKFYFVVLAVVAFILSLGPSPNPSQMSIQTPYTIIFDHLSILEYFRATARFSILMMLALTPLVAMGISGIMKLAKNMQRTHSRSGAITIGNMIGILIVGLILLEIAPVVTTQSVAYDPVYKLIKDDPGQFSIIVLPGSITTTDIALFGQTIHGKPLVNGKISQIGTVFPQYMYTQLFLRILAKPTLKTMKQVRQHNVDQGYTEVELAPLVLTLYHIKYIILVLNQITTRNQLMILTGALSKALGQPIYQDNQVLVYALLNWVNPDNFAQAMGRGPLILFGSGWGPETNYTRAVNSSAQLMVFAPNAGNYYFTMNSTSPFCLTNLSIQESEVCGSYNLRTNIGTDEIFLKYGENLLSLELGTNYGNISSIVVKSA